MSQEVLAVVAGEEITQADFDVYLQSVPREQQAYLSNPQFRQQCLEQLISVYLFAKKGEDEKIEESEEFKRIMASARRDVLAQLAMREILKDATVSDEEINIGISLQKGNTELLNTINEVLAEMKASGEIEELAQKYN